MTTAKMHRLRVFETIAPHTETQTLPLRALLDAGITIVAYNAPYDFSLLKHEALRHGVEPIHDPRRAEITQWFGFIDNDMDGKLVWSEMPDFMKKRLVQGFQMADANADGGLDVNEFSRQRIDASVEELREERDAVAALGLI